MVESRSPRVGRAVQGAQRGATYEEETMSRASNSCFVVTAMLVLSFAPAAAQQADEQVNAIHARALALQQDNSKLIPAARLYLREAELRGAEDPQAVKAKVTAAHLLYYGKRGGEARKVMEAAGDMAAAQGNVLVAAETYLLAAWIAQNSGLAAEARLSAHRAEMIASSPVLAAGDRAAILARVDRVITVSLR
jgi:hypothetical protein